MVSFTENRLNVKSHLYFEYGNTPSDESLDVGMCSSYFKCFKKIILTRPVNCSAMMFNGPWSLLSSNCLNPNINFRIRSWITLRLKRHMALVRNIVCPYTKSYWLIEMMARLRQVGQIMCMVGWNSSTMKYHGHCDIFRRRPNRTMVT